jgi:hypothetical protein
MAKGVEGHVSQPEARGFIRPCLGERARRLRGAIESGEYQCVVGQPSEAQRYPELELGPAMLSKGIYHDVGQRHVAPSGPGLRRLEPDAAPGFFQSLANADDLGSVEIQVGPAQRQELATA